MQEIDKVQRHVRAHEQVINCMASIEKCGEGQRVLMHLHSDIDVDRLNNCDFMT